MFSGAVLVGGRSSRLGIDKTSLFTERIELALRDAGAVEVLRVGTAELPDELPGAGPLAGIATALRHASCPVVVVLACDLPGVRPEGIRLVVDALSEDALVALPPGEPLHAAWRRAALPEVLAALHGGERAVRAVLDRVPVVEVGGVDPAWLRNVNRPEDLDHTDLVQDGDVPEIDIDGLARRHADGAFVLDVRREDEYAEGHVPGAVLIPLDQLERRLEEVPEGEVLVICRSGARSAAAVRAMNAAGRTGVNVAGGTLAWIDAGHPIVTGSEPT